MADESEHALVAQGDAQLELPEDLGPSIVDNQRQIKALQLEVARQELRVQRAVDEQKLLQELQTLDEMTAHKIERADPARPQADRSHHALACEAPQMAVDARPRVLGGARAAHDVPVAVALNHF